MKILCLFIMIATYSTYSQPARFLGYEIGRKSIFATSDGLGNSSTRIEEITGDTIVDGVVWYIMTFADKDSLVYYRQFVRAIDSIYQGEAQTYKYFTTDFYSYTFGVTYPIISDTTLFGGRVIYTSNCGEFKRFDIQDSCVSSIETFESSFSHRTYSRKMGLIYAFDRITDPTVSEWSSILQQPIGVKKRLANKFKSKPKIAKRINGSSLSFKVGCGVDFICY